ncbi:MAG: response regulator [Motiliproteus sp.]
MNEQTFVVLMAEDSEHDIIATRRAWRKESIPHPLYIVTDGEQCLDYLYRNGSYSDPKFSPRPGLLLLDINMPKMSGLEVLKKLRADKTFCDLPVVMLTTSKAEQDRMGSYILGANAFITKPIGFENFSAALKHISNFWSLAGTAGG